MFNEQKHDKERIKTSSLKNPYQIHHSLCEPQRFGLQLMVQSPNCNPHRRLLRGRIASELALTSSFAMLGDVSEDWTAVLPAPMGPNEAREPTKWSLGAAGVQRPLLQPTSHGLFAGSSARRTASEPYIA